LERRGGNAKQTTAILAAATRNTPFPNPRMTSDNRRKFLGRLVALSGAASATACGRYAGMATAAPMQPPGTLIEPWIARVSRATHRAVFDSPAVDSGTALNHAFIYVTDYERVQHASEDAIAAVVVVRHGAMSMVLGSALWQRYALGAAAKVNDPATGQPIERNPYESMSADAIRANEGIEGAIANLQRRGVTVLACDLALSAISRQIAKRLNRDAAEIGAEVRAGLVPGVIIAPSGIYAVTRAQEAGCVLVKST